MSESCLKELAALSEKSHPHDKGISKAIILNRLAGGFYRSVLALGYDLLRLEAFVEDENDKNILKTTFDFLSEQETQIIAAFD